MEILSKLWSHTAVLGAMCSMVFRDHSWLVLGEPWRTRGQTCLLCLLELRVISPASIAPFYYDYQAKYIKQILIFPKTLIVRTLNIVGLNQEKSSDNEVGTHHLEVETVASSQLDSWLRMPVSQR